MSSSIASCQRRSPRRDVELVAGIRLATAPRFHSDVPWPERLAVNGGVTASVDGVVPHDDWGPVDDVASTRLLGDGGEGERVDLFTIPPHLHEAWWHDAADLADPADGAETAAAAALATFAAALGRFLAFKGRPLPEAARLEVVASEPGRRTTRIVGNHDAGWSTPGTAAGATVAVANLGDEATHVVLLNLGRKALAEALGHAATPGPSVGALARVFLDARPRYPLVRVRLDPRDGLLLPPRGIAFGGWTVDKHEIDVMLAVRVEDGGEDHER